MAPEKHLFAACAALALLTFAVGVRLFVVRVREMRTRRIHPQSVALTAQRSQKLEDARASDNYNDLFELPVLAWVFVALRILHSAIQCTYNKVMHRFPVFLMGFFLLGGMWVAYAVSFLTA